MGTSAVFRANSTFKTGFAKIKNKYKKQYNIISFTQYLY